MVQPHLLLRDGCQITITRHSQLAVYCTKTCSGTPEPGYTGDFCTTEKRDEQGWHQGTN